MHSKCSMPDMSQSVKWLAYVTLNAKAEVLLPLGIASLLPQITPPSAGQGRRSLCAASAWNLFVILMSVENLVGSKASRRGRKSQRQAQEARRKAGT